MHATDSRLRGPRILALAALTLPTLVGSGVARESDPPTKEVPSAVVNPAEAPKLFTPDGLEESLKKLHVRGALVDEARSGSSCAAVAQAIVEHLVQGCHEDKESLVQLDKVLRAACASDNLTRSYAFARAWKALAPAEIDASWTQEILDRKQCGGITVSANDGVVSGKLSSGVQVLVTNFGGDRKLAGAHTQTVTLQTFLFEQSLGADGVARFNQIGSSVATISKSTDPGVLRLTSFPFVRPTGSHDDPIEPLLKKDHPYRLRVIVDVGASFNPGDNPNVSSTAPSSERIYSYDVSGIVVDPTTGRYTASLDLPALPQTDEGALAGVLHAVAMREEGELVDSLRFAATLIGRNLKELPIRRMPENQAWPGRQTAFAFKSPSGEEVISPGGKFLVVDFGAMWCPYCIQAAPDFVALNDRFSSDKVGFVWACAGGTKDTIGLRDYVEKKGLAGHYDVVSPDILETWGLKGLPVTVIVNAEGKIVDVKRAPTAADTAAKLEALLGGGQLPTPTALK